MHFVSEDVCLFGLFVKKCVCLFVMCEGVCLFCLLCLVFVCVCVCVCLLVGRDRWGVLVRLVGWLVVGLFGWLVGWLVGCTLMCAA